MEQRTVRYVQGGNDCDNILSKCLQVNLGRCNASQSVLPERKFCTGQGNFQGPALSLDGVFLIKLGV